MCYQVVMYYEAKYTEMSILWSLIQKVQITQIGTPYRAHNRGKNIDHQLD